MKIGLDIHRCFSYISLGLVRRGSEIIKPPPLKFRRVPPGYNWILSFYCSAPELSTYFSASTAT